jgi:hypothetical protein
MYLFLLCEGDSWCNDINEYMHDIPVGWKQGQCFVWVIRLGVRGVMEPELQLYQGIGTPV